MKHHHNTPRRSAAMTFVELLLALGLTAIIGAAMAAMLFAVSRGTSTNNDLRSLIIKHKIINARLESAIRGSKMVLSTPTSAIVLWMTDDNDDGQPNLAELRRIDFNPANQQILSYQTAADMDPAQNVQFTFDQNFDQLTQQYIASGHLLPELWNTPVSAFSLQANNADPQAANLVNYRATAVAGNNSAVVIGAATLRK